MRLRRHARMIVAVLSIFCVVIAVALHAQAPSSMTARIAEQSVEPHVFNTPETEPAEPDVVESQDAKPEQVNDSAAEPSASGDLANVPADNADAPLGGEDLQREVSAAIPHAAQPKVAADAKYEPGVVLVSVRKGITAEQLTRTIMEAG